MKKLFILSLLSVCTAMNAQQIEWGEYTKTESPNSVCTYEGSIGSERFYSFGYYTTGMVAMFNKVGFVSFDNCQVRSNIKKLIKIPVYSLVSPVVTDKDVAVLYYKRSETDSKQRQLHALSLDKSTFEAVNDTVMFPLRQADNLEMISSDDKTKHLVYYFARENEKTAKNAADVLVLYMYDRNFNLLWHQKLYNKTSSELTVRDMHIDKEGNFYAVATYWEDERAKDNYNESLVLMAAGKDMAYNRIVELNQYVKQAKILPLNENEVFVGLNNETSFTSLVYSYAEGGIKGKTDYGLDYILAKTKQNNAAYGKQSKEKSAANDPRRGTHWAVSDILRLENGNVVAVIKDAFMVQISSTGAMPTYFEFTDRNFCVLCINPADNNIVYSQMISRGVKFTTHTGEDGGEYHKPYFFTMGHDFYALYNAFAKEDELSGELIRHAKVNFEKKPKGDNRSRLLKISSDGQDVAVQTILDYKKDKAAFCYSMTGKDDDGNVIVGCKGDKGIRLGIIKF